MEKQTDQEKSSFSSTQWFRNILGPAFALILIVVSVWIAIDWRSTKRSETPQAVAGFLDLSAWNFQQSPILPLSGEWGFYWKQIVDPSIAFEGKPPGFIKIPGTWLSAKIPGVKTNGLGFATHTLRVRLPANLQKHELGLTVGELPSASRIYIDGKLVRDNGRVGENAAEEIPSTRPGFVRFIPEHPDMQIDLQMSNYFHYDGGPAQGMDLGLVAPSEAAIQRSARIDYLVMGCAGIFFVYCAFLFAARPRDKSHLIFSVLCFLILLRIATTNWHLLEIFPGLSDYTQIRLDYFTDFLLPALYFAFLRSLFPDDFGKFFERASLCYAVVGIACTFLLPVHVFTLLRPVIYFGGILILSTCFFLLMRAGAHQKAGALFLGINTLMIMLVVCYDIAHREHLIAARSDLFPFGLVLIICSHGALLGARVSRALKTSEQLSTELTNLNVSLEQRVQERTAALDRLAKTDVLTDLPNRLSLIQRAEAECARSLRHRHTLCVFLLDVDHFKEINDTYGHDAGDLVLKAVAENLLKTIRAHDVIGRYGGDEFVLVLPHSDQEQSNLAAERIRKRISEMQIPLSPEKVLRATVSIGFALLNPGETFQQVLRRADEALYVAKAAGRNRVSAA